MTNQIPSELRMLTQQLPFMPLGTAEFQLISESAPIGIAVLDVTGSVVYANPRLADLLGVAVTDLIGETPVKFTHPDDLATDFALFKEVIEGCAPPTRSRSATSVRMAQ